MNEFEVLMAHELVHSVQFKALGALNVLGRYNTEYWRKDNYIQPKELENIPIQQLNVVDPRFTLDQIAERVKTALQDYLFEF
jgi:hypothetical protein